MMCASLSACRNNPVNTVPPKTPVSDKTTLPNTNETTPPVTFETGGDATTLPGTTLIPTPAVTEETKPIYEQNPRIKVTELMARNTAGIVDGSGKCSAWFEVLVEPLSTF